MATPGSAIGIALLVALAPSVAAQAPPDSGPPMPPDSALTACVIFRVDDGDTIECEAQGRVRLIGIDAPERDQAGADRSLAEAARLMPVGAEVRLELDVEARDRYGRLLAYVWRDGTLINWRLVRDGLAVSFRYHPNLRYAPWFDAAEARASAERRGLNATAGLACRPVDHRKHRC